MNQTTDQISELKSRLASSGPLGIAFSGGVDSTLLAAAALRYCPAKVMGFLGRTAFQSREETAFARHMAERIGLELEIVDLDILAIDAVTENTSQRCYYCKHHLFSAILAAGRSHGLVRFVHGINTDDLSDTRPGIRAATALGFDAPLAGAGFSKKDVRATARAWSLENWDRPSQSCLATRIPSGTRIISRQLEQVDAAEQFLLSQGLSMVRVRHGGGEARIETLPSDMGRVVEQAGLISAHLRTLGFERIALDLSGYGQGRTT